MLFNEALSQKGHWVSGNTHVHISNSSDNMQIIKWAKGSSLVNTDGHFDLPAGVYMGKYR